MHPGRCSARRALTDTDLVCCAPRYDRRCETFVPQVQREEAQRVVHRDALREDLKNDVVVSRTNCGVDRCDLKAELCECTSNIAREVPCFLVWVYRGHAYTCRCNGMQLRDDF